LIKIYLSDVTNFIIIIITIFTNAISWTRLCSTVTTYAFHLYAIIFYVFNIIVILITKKENKSYSSQMLFCTVNSDTAAVCLVDVANLAVYSYSQLAQTKTAERIRNLK